MAIKMDSYGNVYDDELMHYGKKGMKWGKHIMAQEKYWITGNGNSGGFRDQNANMRNDTSGIQWKPTVRPSGGMKVQPKMTGTINGAKLTSASPVSKNGSSRRVSTSTYVGDQAKWKATRNRQGLHPKFSMVNTSKYYRGRLEDERRTKNSVNASPKGTPYGTGGLEVNPNLKTSKTKDIASSNAFRASVQKKASKALGSSISAIQKDQSGLLYKAKKTVNRIFKKISKFFGW